MAKKADSKKKQIELEEDNEQVADIHENTVRKEEKSRMITLSNMYQSWFLDYASYVILERAVPEIQDGLKPVQRRILHSMKELDDGRYNKVANIIGNTMKYHPHGDASIGDALVQLGQKDYLIDCQGNWGNILTGDSAAAPRYIEARLSKFASDVVFNPKTTHWKSSYDGRNKEPITLPVKFPLLLAQGVEGIAVGLASKILPHNFNELIDASIKVLKNQRFELYPDFQTGGLVDVENYNDGLRGGKIRVRAKISQIDKKTLLISEIPFATTTSSLIDSILRAREKGKIKIRKIDDNTSEHVEIIIHLEPNVSPDTAIDALYAFTDCEYSISPNACIIEEEKPVFIGVTEILKRSTEHTMGLLKRELEIRLNELNDDWHYTSLEKIFFEKRIYRELENDVKTWEHLLGDIEEAFKPYTKKLKREITRDDILKLTEKPVRKISKFDVKKADEHIKNLELEMDEVKNHLKHLVDYTINYFQQIKKKYGKNWERKTEIRNFETIERTAVAATNVKLYVNREEGFVGTSLKKNEFVCDCSDLDDIIVFREDGSFSVMKVAEKVFFGKDIIHIDVFRKNDDRTVYNMVYQDGKYGFAYIKRFNIGGITREKPYDLTKGTKDSKVLYFTANPNGEAEKIRVFLKNKPGLRRLVFDYDFKDLAVKGRSSMGNILSRNLVKKIVLENEGHSTLGARKLWFDDTIKRLNADERGQYLGEFKAQDKILELSQDGYYRLLNFDLGTRFDEDMIHIEKFDPKKPITAVYFDGEIQKFYLKRFTVEETDKRTLFIDEHPESYFLTVNTDWHPMLELEFDKKLNKRDVEDEVVDCVEFIGEKSHKAKGKRLSNHAIKSINWLESQPHENDEIVVETTTEVSENDLQLDSELSIDHDGKLVQGELF
ncbi:MAG: DNA gyrase/topoisomerase IV subunit A [Bacteroidales bacterium]|nr:DNA gyrase/topoisomerase IV subunit A [Bacteroidales bacterium]